jgi:hypothetical protein
MNFFKNMEMSMAKNVLTNQTLEEITGAAKKLTHLLNARFDHPGTEEGEAHDGNDRKRYDAEEISTRDLLGHIKKEIINLGDGDLLTALDHAVGIAAEAKVKVFLDLPSRIEASAVSFSLSANELTKLKSAVKTAAKYNADAAKPIEQRLEIETEINKEAKKRVSVERMPEIILLAADVASKTSKLLDLTIAEVEKTADLKSARIVFLVPQRTISWTRRHDYGIYACSGMDVDEEFSKRLGPDWVTEQYSGKVQKDPTEARKDYLETFTELKESFADVAAEMANLAAKVKSDFTANKDYEKSVKARRNTASLSKGAKPVEPKVTG